jgi:hypothetical protein
MLMGEEAIFFLPQWSFQIIIPVTFLLMAVRFGLRAMRGNPSASAPNGASRQGREP